MVVTCFSSYYEKFADGKVVCIDDEIPFEIPNGWEWCRLGQLCTVFGRIGFRGYTKADMVQEGKGAISISPSNMNDDGSMHFHSNTYISWFKYDESPEIKIRENDILVVKTGSSYGKTCVVPRLPQKATINPQIAVLKYIGCNNVYLSSVLSSPNSRRQFERYVLGTSIPTFSQERLSSTIIPLPPLSEQNRIVDLLKTMQSLINQYNKLHVNLEELNASVKSVLRKSILQEAIQGKLVAQDASDEPASVLLQCIREEKERLVKEGKLKKKDVIDSTIFRGDDNKYYEQLDGTAIQIEADYTFPDTWEVVRLAHICRLMDGEKKEGNYVCLDAKYLRGKSSGNILTKGKFVSTGDNIILVDGENSGEVFTVPVDGYMGSTFKQLWLSTAMYKPYLLAFILFYKEALRNSKRGAAIPHLNKELFYNLPIGIPPYQEQERIAQRIDALFQLLK